MNGEGLEQVDCHHLITKTPLPDWILISDSAFNSERFISEADSVLAYEGAKGQQHQHQNRCGL